MPMFGEGQNGLPKDLPSPVLDIGSVASSSHNFDLSLRKH